MLVVGVHNPDDFVGMLALTSDNVVIRVSPSREQAGILGILEAGLNVIDCYLDWKQSIGSGLRVLSIAENAWSDEQALNLLVEGVSL